MHILFGPFCADLIHFPGKTPITCSGAKYTGNILPENSKQIDIPIVKKVCRIRKFATRENAHQQVTSNTHAVVYIPLGLLTTNIVHIIIIIITIIIFNEGIYSSIYRRFSVNKDGCAFSIVHLMYYYTCS